MRCFWDERQRSHAPRTEFFNGALQPAADVPERVDSVLAALGRVEAPTVRSEAELLSLLRQVHDADYLHLLRTAHDEWRAAGRTGDALPYAFPVHRRPLALSRIDARLGQHAYDTCAPISEGTWGALLAGTDTLLGALDAVLGGENAFALTRPPGHHAGPDYMGGYSYLNWAAVAAVTSGRRAAILDLDYHHGNGQQDIFFRRADVLTISIHGDPAFAYPYFTGFAEEVGEEEGAGFNLNLPLAERITAAQYARTLAYALNRIRQFEPSFLVVCLGLDTAKSDPTGTWSLRAADFESNGARVGALGLPTLVVQEGGYNTRTLGVNVRNFFRGLWDGAAKYKASHH